MGKLHEKSGYENLARPASSYHTMKEEAKMTELMRKLKVSQHPVYTTLRILTELQLIKETLSAYPLRGIFELADRGRRVAEKLREIEDILSEPAAETRPRITDGLFDTSRSEKVKQEIEAMKKERQAERKR